MAKAEAERVNPTAERLDIEACEENLGIYTKAGDARSCRDIGLALARELTAVRDRVDVLEDLAGWLATEANGQAALDEAIVRARKAITRARKALGKEG